MYSDDYLPRARDWALPAIVGAMVLVWAGTRLTADLLTWCGYAVGFVFICWACVNFLHHGSVIVGIERRKGRELDFRFTNNHLVEMVASMNSEQLKAIRLGRHVIEIIPWENHPVEKLFGYDVYMYLAWYILTKSTERNVYPINQFQVGTYHFDMLGAHTVDDHQQAKNFHSWLKWMGYAEWGRGNTSMSWEKGYGPEKVLTMLGMNSETYAESE